MLGERYSPPATALPGVDTGDEFFGADVWHDGLFKLSPALRVLDCHFKAAEAVSPSPRSRCHPGPLHIPVPLRRVRIVPAGDGAAALSGKPTCAYLRAASIVIRPSFWVNWRIRGAAPTSAPSSQAGEIAAVATAALRAGLVCRIGRILRRLRDKLPYLSLTRAPAQTVGRRPFPGVRIEIAIQRPATAAGFEANLLPARCCLALCRERGSRLGQRRRLGSRRPVCLHRPAA